MRDFVHTRYLGNGAGKTLAAIPSVTGILTWHVDSSVRIQIAIMRPSTKLSKSWLVMLAMGRVWR